MKFLLRNYEASNGIERAVRDLVAQRHRHDVLENCLRELEEDESIDAVGYGGCPNILGEMELDASFMDGNSRAEGRSARVCRPSCVAAVPMAGLAALQGRRFQEFVELPVRAMM